MDNVQTIQYKNQSTGIVDIDLIHENTKHSIPVWRNSCIFCNAPHSIVILDLIFVSNITVTFKTMCLKCHTKHEQNLHEVR